MQFLKTLFWVVLAIVAVIFANANWNPVKINLWGGMLVETKLPLLIFGAFALGFLPTFAVHRATRWRLRRRIDSQERVIADMHGIVEPPLVVEPVPVGLVAAPPVAPAIGTTLIVEPPAQS